MSRLWPSVNSYHEQPADAGDGEEGLGAGRRVLAEAEQAEADGDLERAQQLRRLIGD